MKTNAPNVRDLALGDWLYAVTSGVPSMPSLPTGVAGERVRLVDGSGLTAVVGTVDLREYGEEALRQKLEDLDWLAAAARAHDRVINALVHTAATVPVGLATVFSDDDSVRAMLDAQHTNLSAALSRLAGRTEWGVKAYADPDAAPTAAGSNGDGDSDGGDSAKEGAGTAFLKRKRAQLAQQESSAKASAERAYRIHERLTRLSVSSRRYAPQNPALTGRRERMLLNGAYLVDDERINEFRSSVTAIDDEARRDGVRVELTGPWPSYSFTAVGLAESSAAADG